MNQRGEVGSRPFYLVFLSAATIGAFVAWSSPSLAQEDVLAAFNGRDGAIPRSALVEDSNGNLYGTTADGGSTGYGTVFRLSRNANGQWVETVLHSFNGPFGFDPGGLEPMAGVVLDSSGNLYGTTQVGGVDGFGVVFKLSPASGGTWKETVLHAFTESDGGQPIAPLVFDAAGNLYGTTSGAPPSRGTVFELSRGPAGKWKEKVLHAFFGPDGWHPFGGLTFDAHGALYGTTNVGGPDKFFGEVFRLTPEPNGAWSESILHSFTSANGDGAYPGDGVVFDAAGNIYGTTFGGGSSACEFGCGIVFELTPTGQGAWKETIIHTFSGGADGAEPEGALTADGSGHLFGTTTFGGSRTCSAGCGVVFELAKSNGLWAESVLNAFDGTDGAVPWSSLLLDQDGRLLGTTTSGGADGNGVVFAIR